VDPDFPELKYNPLKLHFLKDKEPRHSRFSKVLHHNIALYYFEKKSRKKRISKRHIPIEFLIIEKNTYQKYTIYRVIDRLKEYRILPFINNK